MTSPLSASAQPICPAVIEWAKGQHPTAAQKQQIIDWERTHLGDVWSKAPQLEEALDARAALLQKVVRTIESEASVREAMPLPGVWSDWIVLLWALWLPLAQQLDRQQRALGRPFIQGILGGQGTGKTTLSKMLQLILRQLGQETVPLSIDDLYLTYAERQALLKADERLIWRGPPGTHDVALGLETLAAMRSAAGETVSVPQFDKSLFEGQGDRTSPQIGSAPTIVLFEGWFVGAQPLSADVFSQDAFRQGNLPHPIVTEADRQFAQDCNERLAQYVPLWRFLDSLMVLCPRDYRLSQQWRQSAEHKMKAAGKAGLSDDEIAGFVTYFWKALHPELFITPLTHCTETSLVVYIESDHAVGELRSPVAGHSEATNRM